MSRLTLFPITACLLTSFLLWGCSEAEVPALPAPVPPQNSQSENLRSPVIQSAVSGRHIILVADPWCPHNCQAGAAQEGYMVDIAREAMAEAGYTLEYQNISWARALRMTREGHSHGVIGAFRTDAPDFVFPEIPQGRSSISLFTHPDNDWTYSGISSLRDQRLLAINGYSYTSELDAYIEKNRDNRKRVWILSGRAPLKRALILLEKDRTDIFVEDDYVMAWAIRNEPGAEWPRRAGQFGESRSYIAFSPALEDSTELARIMSEGTQKLIESGRVDAILKSYGITGLNAMP